MRIFLGVNSQQGQFWRAPARKIVTEKPGYLPHRNLALPARRELPFRPYLHARIPRITVVEQLPQIIIIIIIIIVKGIKGIKGNMIRAPAPNLADPSSQPLVPN